MKKLSITLTILLASTICFGQGKSAPSIDSVSKMRKEMAKRDSVIKADNKPILSMNDLREYAAFLDSYMSDKGRVKVIISELERIISEAKKRK